MLRVIKALFGAPVVDSPPLVGKEESNGVAVVGSSAPVSQQVPEAVLPSPAAPSSPVAEPVLDQAQVDSDLVSSAGWRHAVEEGDRAWNLRLEELLEWVRSAQSEGDRLPLMMLSEYFFLPITSSELSTGRLTEILRARVEKDFSIAAYRRYMEDKTKTRWRSYPRAVDFYVGEFQQLRSRYLVGLKDLFAELPAKFEALDSHYDALKAAEAEHRPAAGGDNVLRYRGFLNRYAQEHLPGVRPEDFFPGDAPRYLKDYFGSDIKTSGALLLWAMLTAMSVPRGTATASTSEIGIAFEQRLIAEITAMFPGARIEPTPATGDQGADVIFQLGGVKVVIQAKRYSGVVGNAAVQEVFAAQQFYDADYALVVTTSRYTGPAQALAAKLGVELATADDYLRKIQQFLV